MEKITKRNIYEALITYAKTGEMTIAPDALEAFAENEIALLEKRAIRAKATAAKKKAESDALTDELATLLTTEYETTADIAARLTAEDVSLSKVVYRLNKLVADGVAEKTDMKIPATETTKARTVKAFRLLNA